MTKRYTFRLPDFLQSIIHRERARLGFGPGDDDGPIVRAALARVEREPLTDDEIAAARLAQGIAALPADAQAAHAAAMRAAKAAKSAKSPAIPSV